MVGEACVLTGQRPNKRSCKLFAGVLVSRELR